MGNVNEYGVYEYDLTDPGPGPELFNLQSAALTALESGRTSVLKVANTAVRANAVTEHGPASASNPIIVFRANATPGRELEYTTNGTKWYTVDANEPEDTGWVNLTLRNGWATSRGRTPQVRRIGPIIYMQGQVEKDGGSDIYIASLPSGFPGPSVTRIIDSFQADSYFTLTTGGAINASSVDHILTLTTSWVSRDA